MDFAFSPRCEELREQLLAFMDKHVYPAESVYGQQMEDSGDPSEFERALRRIRTTGGTADFDTAFLLAESLKIADRPTGFVLISDGGVSADLQRLAPAGTRYVGVGETDTNRAITDLSVNTAPTGLTARVTIDNTGGPAATQTLRIDVDGATS